MVFSLLLPEEPGTLPKRMVKEREASKPPKEPEHRDSRSARTSSGKGLSGPQTSISVAFALVFAGIVAKRHWFQNFAQWIRK